MVKCYFLAEPTLQVCGEEKGKLLKTPAAVVSLNQRLESIFPTQTKSGPGLEKAPEVEDTIDFSLDVQSYTQPGCETCPLPRAGLQTA